MKTDKKTFFLVVAISEGNGPPDAWLFEELCVAREKCRELCSIEGAGDGYEPAWLDTDFDAIEPGWNSNPFDDEYHVSLQEIGFSS